MAAGQAQGLVDALAERLQRSVVVEDHTLRLIAFSRHYGDTDNARVWSLLNRHSRPDEVDYAALRVSTGPVEVAADPELDLLARLCVPVRDHAMLLGFVWLIDKDRTLTAAEVDDTCSTAAALGAVLHRRLVARDSEDARTAHLLEQLLAGDAAARSAAAGDLLARGALDDDSRVGVVQVALDGPAADPSLLPEAVQAAVRRLAPRTWLARSTPRSATVVVAAAGGVAAHLDGVAATVRARLGPAATGLRVGVGGISPNLGHAATSLQQAGIALAVAASSAWDDPVARWADLGAYQLVGQLGPDLISNELLPHGVFRLLRAGDTHHLLTTAETFLDAGGDKRETAHRLGIHRSTTYDRLDRVEAITGLDLDRGEDRLLLHLALKLRHLERPAGDPHQPVDGPVART